MNKEPRLCSYMGMATVPIHSANNTWLEAEEFCYPHGGRTRRCRAIHEETGKLVIVKCGIPDTYFSIPAVGGWISKEGYGFVFHPSKEII